ncbi:MAG: ABC transporter permease [Candidatus Omnitrophica bacterium]|nr:ABC transporter permease [Candidatus Omnitrophota bacterium]MCM8768226.1 ABC transporter permease [Candidatus Omnitrophota bacterium]
MFSLILFLSRKFTGRGARDNFLWFLNLFSVTGIALGVTTLMLVLGVMNGFSNELKKKIIGAHPTVYIEGRPFIHDYPQVIAKATTFREVIGVAPYLSSQVIYRSSSYLLGGVLKGVDPTLEPAVTRVAEFFKEGRMKSLEDGIVLGSELAEELEVRVGDTITVIGGLQVRQMSFKVTGIIECGVYSYDVSTGLTSLANVQKLFGLGDVVHGVGLRVDNIYASEKIAERLSQALEDRYPVTTWIQKNKILFAALALEKKAMTIILVLIILVASFNIVSTLMITVFRKTRDIGILRAIGFSSGDIGRLFFCQGLLLGGEGLVAGLALGGLLSYLLRRYQFIRLPEFVYNLSRLPIDISSKDVGFICLAVMIIVSLASVYPARRASRLNPVEALRYE